MKFKSCKEICWVTENTFFLGLGTEKVMPTYIACAATERAVSALHTIKQPVWGCKEMSVEMEMR